MSKMFSVHTRQQMLYFHGVLELIFPLPLKGLPVFAVEKGSISYSLFLSVFLQPVEIFEQTEAFSNPWVTYTLLAGFLDYMQPDVFSLQWCPKCGVSGFDHTCCRKCQS